MDFVREWATLAASLVALGTAVWALLQAPSKRNEQAFDKFLEGEFGPFCKKVTDDSSITNRSIDLLRERMSVTESVVKQLPDKETVHRLELVVSTLTGNLNVIGQKVDGVDRTARRVEEFLLEQAKATR